MKAWCFAALLLGAWPLPAHARVERYAIVIGNNRGAADDAPLRYAEADATRMYDVLHELGDFQPVNMVLLRDERVDAVRNTIIAVNQRIRAVVSGDESQAVLLVYYSGHADAESLHLRDSRFAISELAQLVAGSAANFRLVVLDACRSGALTRVKGGRIREPFALPDERLPGDGLAYFTASSVHEDAQESEELRGSFFTHALVSGLLGAADRDGDGAVVLDEAYHYAYESTLRATSRTLAGTQHPTFRYDLRGQGELVLTRPEAHSAERGQLRFAEGLAFLLLREHSDGAVVAELSERATGRMLSVRPGRYFVRARGADVLYEGAITAAAGTTTSVSVDALTRIEYARLVRKGARPSRFAHGPEAGVRVRSTLPNATTPCAGAFVGYALDFEHFSASLRVSGCSSRLEGPIVSASIAAFDAEARLYHAWDLARISFAAGLGGGITLFTQHFETRGEAPARSAAAPFMAIFAGTGLEIGSGFYLVFDAAAETHFLKLAEQPRRSARSMVAFAARGSAGLAKRF